MCVTTRLIPACSRRRILALHKARFKKNLKNLADEERKIITARHMQSTLLIHLNSRNVCVCALHSVYIYNYRILHS